MQVVEPAADDIEDLKNVYPLTSRLRPLPVNVTWWAVKQRSRWIIKSKVGDEPDETWKRFEGPFVSYSGTLAWIKIEENKHEDARLLAGLGMAVVFGMVVLSLAGWWLS